MTKASQLTTLPFIMEGRLNNGYGGGGVNASLPCKVIAMVTVKGVKVVCSVVLPPERGIGGCTGGGV